MQRLSLLLIALFLAAPAHAGMLEQRDKVSFLRGPYNGAFFHRENDAFRLGAAIHFAHGKQHDILLLEPFKLHDMTDGKTDSEYVEMLWHPPGTEPEMENFGPYTAKVAWQLYRAATRS